MFLFCSHEVKSPDCWRDRVFVTSCHEALGYARVGARGS
jgi:hypothetical protein